MIKWTENLVKYRLCWWVDFHDYVLGGKIEAMPQIHKRIRRSTDAPFVPLVLDNAFFDEAFGILTPLEQRFLVGLYIDGAVDISRGEQIIIHLPAKVLNDVAQRAGMHPDDVWDISEGAVNKMVVWLNEHE